MAEAPVIEGHHRSTRPPQSLSIAPNTSIRRVDYSNVGGHSFKNSRVSITNTYEAAPREHESNLKNELLSWLDPPDFQKTYRWAFEQRMGETGTWFIQSPEFQSFEETPGGVLWATGMPGAGKTVIGSTVVKHLQVKFQDHGNVGVTCAFLRYTEPMPVIRIFAGLLGQLVESRDIAVTRMLPVYIKVPKRRGNVQLATVDILEVLRAAIASLSKLFVVIDGLDEANDSVQAELLRLLLDLDVNLVILSRPLDLFLSRVPRAVHMPLRARVEDIDVYVTERISRSFRLQSILEGRLDAQEELRTRVKTKSDGMFLVARFQMDSIVASSSNVSGLFEALSNLPTGVNDMYQHTLDRINAQTPGDALVAHCLFTLLLQVYQEDDQGGSSSARPYRFPPSTEDIQCAIAVDVERRILNPNDLTPISLIITACCGLVVQEEVSVRQNRYMTFRFIHHTARGFLNLAHIPGRERAQDLDQVLGLVDTLLNSKADSCHAIESVQSPAGQSTEPQEQVCSTPDDSPPVSREGLKASSFGDAERTEDKGEGGDTDALAGCREDAREKTTPGHGSDMANMVGPPREVGKDPCNPECGKPERSERSSEEFRGEGIVQDALPSNTPNDRGEGQKTKRDPLEIRSNGRRDAAKGQQRILTRELPAAPGQSQLRDLAVEVRSNTGPQKFGDNERGGSRPLPVGDEHQELPAGRKRKGNVGGENSVFVVDSGRVDRRQKGPLTPEGPVVNRGRGKKSGDLSVLEARDTDIVILILGATGAGKSSFINRYLSGIGMGEPVKVGDAWSSCTVNIQSIVVENQVSFGFPHLPRETRIVIVDTPGFDNTLASDFEILKRIASWLQGSYRKNMVLGGVIYLHDISQDRFSGTARRNLEMFNHLCGDAAPSKVVLVTSKWRRAYDRDSSKREEELKQVHWKNMLNPGKNGEKGAKVMRLDHTNEQGSARKVVESILNRVDRAAGENLVQESLQIQEELVSRRKFLPDTNAGLELKRQIQAMIDAQTQMLALEAEAAKGDPEAEKQLREAEEKVRLLAEQVRKLKVPIIKRIGRWMGFGRG